MKPEHQRKVDELVNTLCSTLKATAQRLYHSGCIEPEDYSVAEYVLARILVTAAIYQHKDDFSPLHPEHRRDVKNLQYF